MLFMKNALKPLLFIIGIILFLTLFTTFFSFFNLIGGKILSVIKFLIPIIAVIVGGILIGKRSLTKGWLSGIKLGGIFIVILILFDLLGLGHSFKLTDFIYYLILIGSTTFGGMVGINLSKKNKL